MEVSTTDLIETRHGFKMFLNPNDNEVCRVLRESKEWEGSETFLLSKEIMQGHTVVDIGAHIGYYTLLFSKLVGPSGVVYSFEPNPYSFAYLEKNVQLNSCRNVQLVRAVVSTNIKPVKIWAKQGGNTGDVRMFPTLNGEEIEVQGVSLDSYFPESTVDCIKIDAQGAEYNILSGAMRLMARSTGLKMMVEYSRDLMWEGFRASPEMFLPLLEGFDVYDMKNNVLTPLSKDFLKSGGDGNLFCRRALLGT